MAVLYNTELDSCRVYSWGWGVHGQLGHGDTEERLVPKVISSFSNQTITKVAVGYCHSLALNSQVCFSLALPSQVCLMYLYNFKGSLTEGINGNACFM